MEAFALRTDTPPPATQTGIPVVIYVRVSTEEQAMEGYSIEAQLENLRRYCLQRGFVIIKEYVEEGISAKNIKGRPNLLSLLQDAESGLFKPLSSGSSLD